MSGLSIKRVYAPPAPEDGQRILVDRLWPRGISREKAMIGLWLKDLAPSNALRAEFHAQPSRWREFRAAYALELAQEPTMGAVAILRSAIQDGPVCLLYAARDETRNNAEALRLWLLDEGSMDDA